MCPVCIAAALLLAGGAASGSGLAALSATKLFTKTPAPAIPQEKEN